MSLSEREQLVTDILDIGESLQASGAEIGRVEDTVTRLFSAYGAEKTDVLAILSDIKLTVTFPGETPISRMRRILGGDYDTDFASIEKWNALSRRLCAFPVGTAERHRLMDEVRASKQKEHSRHIRQAVGYMLTASAFAVLFDGGAREGLLTLLAAVLIFLAGKLFDLLHIQKFLKIYLLSLLAGMCSALSSLVGLDPGPVAIGSIMLLITGNAVTTSIRDMLTGETISGTLRMVESLLAAGFVVLGLATAMLLSGGLFSGSGMSGLEEHLYLQILMAALSAAGYALMCRAADNRLLLSALGGALSWAAYRLGTFAFQSELIAYLMGGAAGMLYAEIAAHLFKLPVLVLMIPAVVPLVPGRTLYLSMANQVRNNTAMALSYASSTAVAAVGIAAGMVLVTAVTASRTHVKSLRKNHKKTENKA